jgi:protein-S-isoprenylcysteine O-methyltransferase Ste14
MPGYAYAIAAAGWLIWVAPFFLNKRNAEAPVKRDRRARWEILLQGIAYSLLWQNRFWARSPEAWRVALSVLFFVLAGVFSWSGARALGHHWRFDAGLSADHELVRSGVYRVVRHPIYTSMLFVLLGTGFMFTPMPMLVVAVLVFIVGTEIRVRVEDGLLASRFDAEFRQYQRSVPAYIPFLKHSKPTNVSART